MRPPSEFPEELWTRGVAGRAEVARLATVDSSRAIAVARGIEHPWYRCQAIASIVEANLSHPAAEALLVEALAAAYSQTEPNRVASVARWPLQLLLCENPLAAAAHTSRLLRVLGGEPHGLRRVDGVRAILIAVVGSCPLRAMVLDALGEALKLSHGDRTERIVDEVVQMLLPLDRVAAAELLGSRPVTRFTKRSRALLAAGGGG